MTSNRVIVLAGIAVVGLAAVDLLTGCSTLKEQRPVSEQTGAELWQNNCVRCHQFRSPASLSDAQWDVAGHHMRVRANLTADEHEKIVAFLKASN